MEQDMPIDISYAESFKSFTESANKWDDAARFRERRFDVFLLCFFALLFLICWHPVSGTSMEPTYADGSLAVCSRFAFAVNRGDVVIAKHDDESYYVIKRVIGVPGDTVEIKTDGSVYVNGELSKYGSGSSYTLITQDSGLTLLSDGSLTITLGDDEYYLLGDNRTASKDSRYVGPFSRAGILRTVLFVIPPLFS